MAPKAEACAECAQNCLFMHKKEWKPSPVSTSFFKVMYGDECSKLLFLPPRFAHSVQKNIGKSTWIEDQCGEKWKVKFKNIDGTLAFDEEGWNKFWLDHGLKVGDFLVFHYIMESHFVVLMYGESGTPENRHFGFTRHQMKETRKKRKLTDVDHVPSNVDTNGHHHEVKHNVESQQKETKIKKKRTDDTPPDVINIINNHSVASSSRSQPSDSDKETSQRSKPLVNTNTNDTVCETPMNHDNIVHVEDEELGGNGLHEALLTESSPEQFSGGRKDDVAAGGGGDETKIKESVKVLETQSNKIPEKPKEIIKNSIKKRLRSTMFPMTPTKIGKKEPVLTGQTDVSGSKLRDVGGRFASPKTKVTPTKIVKKEHVSPTKHDTSGSNFHNVGVPPASTRTPHKPIAKPIESPKKNLTTNHGSIGATTTSPISKMGVEKCIKEEIGDLLQKVKPEPVDYDESPSTVATNPSFSAVMSSFQYLELPKWVKLKSKVILLRNKGDLWPVLYQNKLGLKALTQSWEVFARQRGIQVGDNCEFVLESEANSNFTCSVFTVHVTRK